MCDNFASYSLEDRTICFKFYFPDSFRETKKMSVRNVDETVLKEQVISIYDVAQLLKRTHVANHSPISQNISTFTFPCMLKDAMKIPPNLTLDQDLARQIF